MPLILIFTLFFTSTIMAKDCFSDKQSKTLVCYKRYFDRANIHNPKQDERYYTSKKGKIYAIGDRFEVRFNAVGAVLFILNNYEIDFVDKKLNDLYIFKVRDKNELFPILQKLNNLSTIQKANPVLKRKFTRAYVEYQLKKRQKKLDKIKGTIEQEKIAMQQAQKSQGSTMQGGNFLKGEAK